jgi:cytochrome c oxidase subunit 2
MKKTLDKSILFYLLDNFLKEKTVFNFSFILFCDAPDFWQLRLQDPASSTMEGILLFNKHLLFIVVMIVILTGWLLFNTIYSYDEFNSSQPANFFHSNELEIVWTSLPALTLLTLASPSFSLLYSMDEISIPDFLIKILGY